MHFNIFYRYEAADNKTFRKGRTNSRDHKSMSSDFLKARLRAQETEFQRRNDLNAYKTIRETLKATGQLEVSL